MAAIVDDEGNIVEEFDEWELEYQADLEAESELMGEQKDASWKEPNKEPRRLDFNASDSQGLVQQDSSVQKPTTPSLREQLSHNQTAAPLGTSHNSQHKSQALDASRDSDASDFDEDEVEALLGKENKRLRRPASSPLKNPSAYKRAREDMSSGRGTSLRSSVPAILSDSHLYLLSRPPMDGETMDITLTEGERFFVRFSKPESSQEAPAEALGRSGKQGLLKGPIRDMLRKVEEERDKKLMANVQRDLDRMERHQDETTKPTTVEDEKALSPVKSSISSGVLWVDKYAPVRFTDLISDEATNREVLKWIKGWDSSVFGTNVFQALNGNPFGSKPASAVSGDGRPEQKILLICGPPGLGKTTLAHVCARQAGYCPVEVNASDDRSATVLRTRVINAMEMRSVYGEKRPNLIILDEIDGAMNGGEGKNALSMLVEMASATTSKNVKEVEDSEDSKGSKRKRAVHPLTRPIVCICNDQYSPVLRPLRKIAKIVVFKPTNPQRLIQRLKVICKLEKLLIRQNALSLLCSTAENDIRFCLNSLQFLKSTYNAEKIISTDDIGGGQKDQAKGLFETWSAVFQKARQVERLPTMQQKMASVSSREQAQIGRLYQMIGGFGDQNKLLEGVHENFLRIRYTDPSLTKTASSLDWMIFADQCLTRANALQQWHMLQYVPPTIVGVHFNCRSDSRPRIEFPRKISEAHFNRISASNIVWTFLDGLLAIHSGKRQLQPMVEDFIAYLLFIISPHIRNVNITVMNEMEKQILKRLAAVMAFHGLSYTARFDSSRGGNTFVLEPGIDQLANFTVGEAEVRTRQQLPPSLLQLITHEATLERLRKTEKEANGVASDASGRVCTPALEEDNQEDRQPRKQGFSFGTRPAIQKAENLHVRYKFQEGFTNAVRRPVRITEFL